MDPMRPDDATDRDELRDQIDKLDAQCVADQDTIKHLRDEQTVNLDKIANLEIALATARRIGTAVGIVMHHQRIGADEAFQRLARASQNDPCRRKLRDIAEDVIYTGTLPDQQQRGNT